MAFLVTFDWLRTMVASIKVHIRVYQTEQKVLVGWALRVCLPFSVPFECVVMSTFVLNSADLESFADHVLSAYLEFRTRSC